VQHERTRQQSALRWRPRIQLREHSKGNPQQPTVPMLG
jgi:hypothetical protein